MGFPETASRDVCSTSCILRGFRPDGSIIISPIPDTDGSHPSAASIQIISHIFNMIAPTKASRNERILQKESRKRGANGGGNRYEL